MARKQMQHQTLRIKQMLGINFSIVLIVSTAFLTLASSTALEAQEVIATVLNPDNQHSYTLFSASGWTAAQAKAESLGSNLVVLESAAEEEFVLRSFSMFGGIPRNIWIGLRDPDSSLNSLNRAERRTEFEWVDGTPVTYSNWETNEPNNINSPEPNAWEYFGHLWHHGHTRQGWNNFHDLSVVFGVGLCGVVEWNSNALVPFGPTIVQFCYFSAGTDEWTVATDAPASPFSPLGNQAVFWIQSGTTTPGGHIQCLTPSDGSIAYWVAPPRFLGNQTKTYGGTLSCDLRRSTASSQSDVIDFALVGQSTTLVLKNVQSAGTDWGHNEITLSESAGWQVGSLAGPLATKEQIQAVLQYLKAIYIRAGSGTESITADLDNVIMSAPRGLPDADGDGVPDATDGCPDDPEKTGPGNCGCGNPDDACGLPVPFNTNCCGNSGGAGLGIVSFLIGARMAVPRRLRK